MSIAIGKEDIGAEIMSILTQGMYLDPKDALREYIQNGVDAEAKNILIKIRQNNIVVEDDGIGMDITIMRKAVRLGISEKNPKKKVGFMGIGIYSSFHLCNELIIYSKTKNNEPSKLVFDFKAMRDILDGIKEARLANKIKDGKSISLQELLGNNISLEELGKDDVFKQGTRVEMIGVNPDFFKSLAKFEEVADYLRQVVPLPFNPQFSRGAEIENKLIEICEKHNAVFERIDLTLQINDKVEKLYRPYIDTDFDTPPLKPYFYSVKKGEEFFGVAWGCLHADRATIKNKEVRGFIIKKQGFAIGSRHAVIKYFKRATYFNRYIGEIVVVHSHLLPNGSRTDFEYSPLRTMFYDWLNETATYFNNKAADYQEISKAEEELNEAVNYVKKSKSELNYIIDNNDLLLDILWKLKGYQNSLDKRIKREILKGKNLTDAKIIIQAIKALTVEIRGLIDDKKKKSTIRQLAVGKKVANALNKVPITQKEKPKILQLSSLFEVIESSGCEIENDLKKIIELVDECFVKASCDGEESYLLKLKELKEDIDELFEEE